MHHGFKNDIKESLLQNCNISIDDINIAEAIYGTPKPILQGKMKRTTPPLKKKHLRLPIPLPIVSYHKNVQVYANVLYN